MSGELKRIVLRERTKHNLIVTPLMDKWLNRYGGEIILTDSEAKMLLAALTTKPRDRSSGFSASSGGQCPRRQMFTYIGVPQRSTTDSVGQIRFIDGKMKHLTMQLVLLKAGAVTRIESPINVPYLKFKGSLDGEHDAAHYGVEIKTTQAFNYFSDNGPSRAHKLQIAGYFLGKPRLTRFSLLYWDTRSRDWIEYIVKRDSALVYVVKRQLQKLNQDASIKRLPEVLRECQNGKGPTYNECPYAHVCLETGSWSDARLLTQRIPINPQVQSGGQNTVANSNAQGTGRVQRRIVRKKSSPARNQSKPC